MQHAIIDLKCDTHKQEATAINVVLNIIIFLLSFTVRRRAKCILPNTHLPKRAVYNISTLQEMLFPTMQRAQLHLLLL